MRIGKAVRCSFVVAWWLASASALHAQTLGTVAGTVKDPSDAVLPGVTVEASSPVLIEKVRSVVTDGTGKFTIVNLPPGMYDVSFALPGFATVKREAVEVSIGVTATINIVLRVGAVSETVTVTGETPVVDLQSAQQTTVANAAAFKELPTGGSWVNMAQLIPAVNSAFFGSASGTRISPRFNNNECDFSSSCGRLGQFDPSIAANNGSLPLVRRHKSRAASAETLIP